MSKIVQSVSFQIPKGAYYMHIAQKTDIVSVNKRLERVYCKTLSERDRIVKLAHEKGITHITNGPKQYGDYQNRVKKGIYTDEHKYLSFYGGDFFAILEFNPFWSTPFLNSTSINDNDQ